MLNKCLSLLKQGYIDQLVINCVTYCRSGYSAAKSGLRHFHCLARVGVTRDWVSRVSMWGCQLPENSMRKGSKLQHLCSVLADLFAASQEIH